jgi:hypothetical protein
VTTRLGTFMKTPDRRETPGSLRFLRANNTVRQSSMRFTAFLLSSCIVPAALAQVPFQFLVKTGTNNSLVPNNATLNLAADGINKASSLTVVLAYQGTTIAVVSQPQIFGLNSFTVTAQAGLPATLSPGDSLSVVVQYTPSDAAQATAQLSIPYTEKSATSQSPSTAGTIGFTLIGTAPSLVVTYTLPTDGNVVTVTTGSTIGFPSTVVGASITATIGVVNRGSGTGSIQSISLSGNPFSLQSTPLLPLAITAGSAVQFGVRYSPSQMGNNSGTLKIALSDRTMTLGLQGTAIASVLTYQLVQGTKTASIVPGQLVSFPDTNVGNKSSLLIVAKNTSPDSTTISGAAVAGTGFAIADAPLLPIILNVNDTTSFTVTFVPTQGGASTGRLRVGNDSFDLAGTAIGAQLVFAYTAGSTTSAISVGGTVLFTPQTVGQKATDSFSIRNTGTDTATLSSIGISGTPAVFGTSNLPQLPIALAPGQSTQFSVVFSPANTGLSSATLFVDAQQFTLSGFGNLPPAIPTYSFTGASGNQSPMSQVAIGLSLDSGYAIELDGKLTISVDNKGLTADPALQFATGGRVVAFTIPPNTTQAIFSGGNSSISLQTGTVAGTIAITPSFALPSSLDITPAAPAMLSLSVPAGPPHLLNALVSQKSQNTLTLQIFGYGPTRTLSTLQFQFLAQSEANVANGVVSVNIQPNAQGWFSSAQSANFGGQFMVSVPFSFTSNQASVSSPLSLFQSVSITASNDLGTSNAVAVVLGQ